TDFDKIALTANTKFQTDFVSDLNGIVKVKASVKDRDITFIPYNSWDNREAGEMKVWIDYVEN
ncbi:hypothetical protein EZS27_024147, partial [termite gut metagenome]